MTPRLALATQCFGLAFAVGCNAARTVGTDTAGTTAQVSDPGASGSGRTTEGSDDGETESGGDGPRLDVADGAEGGVEGGGPPPIPDDCEAAADSHTSVGCEFYGANLPGAKTVSFGTTNTSSKVARVEVRDIDGVVGSASVPPGGFHIFTFDTHAIETVSHLGEGAFSIVSDQPLQAFQFLPAHITPSADASILLPAHALGQRHRVVSWPHTGTHQYIAVLGTQDETEVTVQLTGRGAFIDAGEGLEPLSFDSGVRSLTRTLQRFETLVLVAQASETPDDKRGFSGSLVTSDAPVAVFSGADLVFIPDEGQKFCCGDTIATAVPPTTVYGKAYAGVKFLPIGDEQDVWRFIGDLPGTEVQLRGGIEERFELDPGEVVDIHSSEVFWAEGDRPFALVHYMVSGKWAAEALGGEPFSTHDCTTEFGNPGDPAINWMFPQQNWLGEYRLPVGPSTAGQWCHDHMTVVAPQAQWSGIRLDGAPLPSPTTIGATDMAFAYVPLRGPSHHLVAPPNVGVEATVYGYVHNGSYVYPGGMGLQPLNPPEG